MTGLYWDRQDDQFVKAYMKDGELRVSLDGDGDVRLKPVNETRFHLANVSFGDQVSFIFEPAEQGKMRLLFQGLGDQKPTAYEPVEQVGPAG